MLFFRSKKQVSLYVCTFLFLLIFNLTTYAQQIVLDPVLNKNLANFQQQFPQFIQQNPELSGGSSPQINLNGGKGKITFTFQQQGQYLINYDSLQFNPTMPISRDSFQVVLKIRTISFMGNASLKITAKGKNFDLQCQNNLFNVNNVSFSALVTVDRMNTTVANPQVNFDPKMIMVSVPCLKKSSNDFQTINSKEIANLDEIAIELESEINNVLKKDLTRVLLQNSQPSSGTLNKVDSSLQSSATQSNSSVSTAANSTSMSSSMSVTTSASSPCGGAVSNDAKLVVADLSTIAAQANANGFKTAVQDFINVLKSILPTLSKPSQDLVQKFIDDLTSATADGQISTLEQITLSTDFYNVVLSTGITTTQLNQITSSLEQVLSTLSGISTAQLKSDLQKLKTDAQACLKQ